MAAKRRIPVAVDVLWDEAGDTYYQVIELGQPFVGAPVCGLSQGVFIQESNLDDWLEGHRADVQVVKDYRTKEY